MQIGLVILIAAGTPVFVLAIRAHWRTSLRHALFWTLLAWMAWGVAFAAGETGGAPREPCRYAALCLTGCAGIAVLGARRPHVFAWNFVVLGLFAVMMLPLIESRLLGTPPADALRIVFLAGTIAVAGLNYLPTRLGPAALVLMAACAGQIVRLFAPDGWPDAAMATFDSLLVAVPWLGWLGWRGGKHPGGTEFDQTWLSFRDAWGLMWSQRVREQFNRAAENAGWSVTLRWRGLRGANGAVDGKKHLQTLRAALQRFVREDSP